MRWLAMIVAVALGSIGGQGAFAEGGKLRLYAFKCGDIHLDNGAPFSDSWDYDGRPLDLMASCYVIRHAKGTLLWDAGLPDAIYSEPEHTKHNGPFHLTVAEPFVGQLAAIGISPADVNFVAFSHSHFDHVGNAAAFAGATWIVQQNEYDWLFGESGYADGAAALAKLKDGEVKVIKGDHDVFGDGSVRIISAPGHTPGHMVLYLALDNAGPVVLSGDLFHMRESHDKNLIPTFNTNRADSLASQDRIEKILGVSKARFIVQHDPADYAELPHAPKYLD